MDKRDLLKSIEEAAANKSISRDELMSAFDAGSKTSVPTREPIHVSVSEILYYIGGAIVFIGIGILVFQNWTTLPDLAKILVTLGSAIAAFVVAVMFDRTPNMGRLGLAFHFLGSLLLPIGISVTSNVMGYTINETSTQSVVSVILVLAFSGLFYYLRKDLFLIFLVFAATWFFFAFTNFMAAGNPGFILADEFTQYRFLLVGLAFMLVGYYFTQINKPHLSGFLYGIGSLAFLGTALALGGFYPEQNAFWELIYPALVFGILFLSVYLKSRSFLVFGAIFLMGYIFKITTEYFREGLGWPLSLVIIGFALIGVGYLTVYLNKRYLSK